MCDLGGCSVRSEASGSTALAAASHSGAWRGGPPPAVTDVAASSFVSRPPHHASQVSFYSAFSGVLWCSGVCATLEEAALRALNYHNILHTYTRRGTRPLRSRKLFRRLSVTIIEITDFACVCVLIVCQIMRSADIIVLNLPSLNLATYCYWATFYSWIVIGFA